MSRGWDTLIKEASVRADRTIFAASITPQETLQKLADACSDLGVGNWDVYGEGGAVTQLEEEVARLVGTEDAAYFPSGIMAQQAALRVHTDNAGDRRVALPDLSHLLVHEEDGPRLLHGFQFEYLTVGPKPPHPEDLDRLSGSVGAILIELPLRDAGCELPDWQQLVKFSEACRKKSIALHIDGARLWESVTWMGRELSEIVALADTTYLSFYKGLGSMSGSILVGDADVLRETRLWRRRLGGTVFHATAEAVGALVGLRELLPKLPETVRWAQDLVACLPDGLAARPSPPHTNQFLLYASGDADKTNEALLTATRESNLAFCRPWKPTGDPARIVTELAIGSGSAAVSPEEVAALL